MFTQKQTKIADFHGNIDERASGGKVVKTLESAHLSRLERIIYILKVTQPLDYFPYGFGKFYAMYEEIGTHSGLVYNGDAIKISAIHALPHNYGEFSYLSRYGAMFFAGFFNMGIPVNECRVSIEGYGTWAGRIQATVEKNQVKLITYQHEME